MSPAIRRQGPVALLDGALSSHELDELLSYSVRRADDFVPTRVLSHEEGASPRVDVSVRRNVHLSGTKSVPGRVREKLRSRLLSLAAALDSDAPADIAAGRFEAEITATRDGGFFAPHVDNGSRLTTNRSMSFVLFFSRSPRPFHGGDLCVETDWREGDRLFIFDARRSLLGHEAMTEVIEPEPNRLVLFRSHRLHEIRPVSTTSDEFADARFTVTGFMRTGAR